jgi:hypothetical protein
MPHHQVELAVAVEVDQDRPALEQAGDRRRLR